MNRPSSPDDELIQRYLRGDREAFPQLFNRYQHGILMLVRHYFRNPERSEEVFQEVFLKLIERADYYDGSGSFKAWFFTLCRNHCIDRLRQQNRRHESVESEFRREDSDYPTPIAAATSEQAPADRVAFDRELGSLLDESLNRLPEEQREVFLLKERGELTFEEIARLQKVSVNTVKSRMRYALESLRRSLKSKSFVKEVMS